MVTPMDLTLFKDEMKEAARKYPGDEG